MPNVTTVIVTRNHCEQLLAALGNARMPVVVVDNGSDDGSADAVEAAFPDVTLVRMARDQGIEGFNAGARAARTRYVAFSDDCCWWERRTLSIGARTLDEHPTLGLISATVKDVTSGVHPISNALAASPLGGRAAVPGIPVLGFPSCACLVRRQPFLDVGGFDAISGFGGEEQRVALDLADAGWAVRHREDIVAWTNMPRTWKLRRLQVRDEVLTAVMRRPLRVAASRAWNAGRHDIAGFLGVLRAVPLTPAALRRRRPVTPRVEQRARLVDRRLLAR